MKLIRMMAILALLTGTISGSLVFAADLAPTNEEFQEEYDKISAIKMDSYDVIRGEITLLQSLIGSLHLEEKKLLTEKTKAEAAVAEDEALLEATKARIRTALARQDSVKKENEKLLAATVRENAQRQKEIEKLTETLKEASEKRARLERSKEKFEKEISDRETEYKNISKKLLALKAQSGGNEADDASASEEAGILKQRMMALESEMRSGNTSIEGLNEEILEWAGKIRSCEGKISDLENEESSAKMLEAEDAGGETAQKLKENADATAARLEDGKKDIERIETELKEIRRETLRAEQDLAEKTGELEVRISALVAQSEWDEELLPSESGESDKTLSRRLDREERKTRSLKRRAEKSQIELDDLKLKYDKEMLDKHFNLAVLYEKDGLYENAEKEYKQCLEIDPKDAEVHYNLAVLYDDRLNKNDKALKHYKKFLQYQPTGESKQLVKNYILRAELEKRFGVQAR